jgi:hypothetical protein
VVGEPTNHVTGFTGVLGNPGYYFNNLSWVDASAGNVPDGYLIKSSDVDFASIVDPLMVFRNQIHSEYRMLHKVFCQQYSLALPELPIITRSFLIQIPDQT